MPPRLVEVPVLKLLREQLEYERARYDALLREVLALKRDGFAATVQYETPPTAPLLPAVVTQAIAQRAEAHTAERRELERAAADLVRSGAEPDDIAARVLDGEAVDL